MQWKPGWGNLEQRTARMRDEDATAEPTHEVAHRTVTASPGAGGHPQPRHVWVTVTGVTDDQAPGVLLDWRRDPADRWEALVVWASGGGRHSAHARIDWLAAHHVTPR